MAKLGVLAVTYSGRCSAMVEALARSKNYDVSLYIADNQKNPLNVQYVKERGGEHRVIPNSDVNAIVEFAREYANKIDLAISGPEKPIIGGLRNQLEVNRDTSHITALFPTEEAALEGDKAAQRIALDACYPSANPTYMVLDPAKLGLGEAKDLAYSFWKKLNSRVVAKPARPQFGKGVGVYGDHFTEFDHMWSDYFLPNFGVGPVVLEEALEGEEFSGQFLCDGIRLIDTPFVRDYKRRDDDDKGPNTGGTAAYRDRNHKLPFMSDKDAREARLIARKFFEHASKLYGYDSLRGIPFYIGFMATRNGVKLIENNSRPGDPEWQAIMATMDDDFADVCVRMAEHRLRGIKFANEAAVVLYKMPPHYTGKGPKPENTEVDLSEAYRLGEEYGRRFRVYPASMELRDDGSTHSLSSRAVCTVGTGKNIEEARFVAQVGLDAIKGDLWQRRDPATRTHIQKSINHMRELRSDY